ncbi:MAG: 5-(carboxyamino)imidazole ribonucleotide mutase [Thermodesulfobacteriota bacterium]|nr:5-(carboxyamino)imidazole ribonucleotide mutase [Thermodesulfobacteriota bacterium]
MNCVKLIIKGKKIVTKVGILLGSDSDLEVMEECSKLLKYFSIPHELVISSAHRSPERTINIAKDAKNRGWEVIIVGAGGAAHLGGVVAAHSSLPVIGVPIDSTTLKGIDSLLSIAQMPGGVPVATMAIGKPGAKNAAIFAAQIIALKNDEIRDKLNRYKKDLACGVLEKDKKVSFTWG